MNGQAKPHILVVDDNPINVEIIGEHLREKGVKVSNITDGNKVLDSVENNNYDMILLDILMADISGLDILKSIRNKYSPLDLPIIMVTSKSDSKDIANALDLGANDIVSKPIDFVVTWARIKNHLLTRQLNESLEMERAQKINTAQMKTLLEMAGSMAHEVNNPLTILFGKIEVLKDVIKEEKALKLLDGVGEIVMRISNVIKGLRNFSGQKRSHFEKKLKLASIIKDTLGICGSRFQSIGIQLIHDNIQKDVYISGSRGMLMEALYNLLKNSFDAVKDVERPRIEISTETFDDYCKIVVADNGVGVDPKVESKIMLPFFTTHDVGKHMGLGLSSVKGIMEAHNGKVIYERKDDLTKFSLIFKIEGAR